MESSTTDHAPAPPVTTPPDTERTPAAKAAASAPATPGEATEFDPILPDLNQGGSVVLAENEIQLKERRTAGVECKMHPVRMRQLLAIGRTLTGSTRPVNLYQMIAPVLEAQTEAQRYAAGLAAFSNLIVTVPHSENEFINLVNTLIKPVDKLDGREANEFWAYMDNPDPEDVLKVMAQCTVNERDRYVELGKALMSFFPAQTDEETPTSDETTSESLGQPRST